MNPHTLDAIQYGIFAIGCKGDGDVPGNACIVNTVSQVTLKPLQVAVAVNCSSFTNELIKKHRSFSVSVLSQHTPERLIKSIGFKSGRNGYKLGDVEFFTHDSGIPVVLEKCSCWFVCDVREMLELGTHTLFIAEVTDTSDSIMYTPMTYEYYHEVYLGRPTPVVYDSRPERPAASNDKKPEKIQNKEEKTMSDKKTYTCTVCGYTYDGEIPFEELPDDWVCPLCGVGKDMFEAD